jgi:hypothetical protein
MWARAKGGWVRGRLYVLIDLGLLHGSARRWGMQFGRFEDGLYCISDIHE